MNLSSDWLRCCIFFLVITFGSAMPAVCESSFSAHDLPEEGNVEEDQLKKLLGEDAGSVSVLDRVGREVERQAFVPPEDLVELLKVVQPESLDFNRDEAESQALRFLADNPTTPFRAEIYFHVGAMFGPAKGNLSHDQKKLESYFKLASREYGDQYSKHNRSLKTHLAGLPGQHQERLSFYRWQSSFLHGQMTLDDVFPTRSMAGVIKYGLEPLLTNEERSLILSSFTSALPPIMEASENWLVRVSSLPELNDYIELFPGSSIAAKAASVIQKKK